MTQDEYRASRPNTDWEMIDRIVADAPPITRERGERLWYLFFGQNK